MTGTTQQEPQPVTAQATPATPAAAPVRIWGTRNLALGIERLGLVAVRHPIVVVLLLVLLSAGAALGVQRLRIDDSLSQLFRSDTPQYRQFEEVSRRFPSAENDVLVVLQGKTLLDRQSLDHLRELVTDLQLVEGVRGIISLFSARAAPEGGGVPAALIPDELPEGYAYDQLRQRILDNEILRGKLLSDDGQLALVVVALEPDMVIGQGLGSVVGDIRKAVTSNLEGTHVTGDLSGVPVMQLEIRNAVERDRLVYNATGFAAGCLIAIVFFRRLSFMLIAAGPPLVAILLSLGALGWLDFRLNMFLNVMTPLIMIISFADSMQLTFAARDRLMAGETSADAFRNAVLAVGPACVLTHATAAISFIALQFSDSDLIRTFGEAGLLATVIALVAVLMVVPALGVMLTRGWARKAALAATDATPTVAARDTGVNALRGFCAWIAERMVGRPIVYSLMGLAVVVALGWIYTGLEPRYRLADQVPDSGKAVEASHDIDVKLTGANPVDVLVTLPKGTALYDAETLAVIADVHAIVEHQAGVGNVWSVETLRRWLAEKTGKTDVATLKQYIDILPQYLKGRFIDPQQDAVIVAGRIPDKDASQLLPVIDKLEATLAGVQAKHPGFQIAVTGLSAIAARSSAAMIDKLNRGLTIEIVFMAAFIGLAFRSVVVMLVSILPGIFPILLSGALLRWSGMGLQFASMVALTVSFGLGLSATIHFLNRMGREDHPDRDPSIAVERATVLVGPALIVTTVVLACGLVVTVFSDLPSLRLFGWLSAFALMSALVADMLILRPTTTVLARIGRRTSRWWRRSPPREATPVANET